MNDSLLLRAGIVGVGHFGRFHTRHLSHHENWTCAGVFDIDKNRSLQISEEFGVSVFKSYDSLLQNVDAVFICSPTAHHYELGLKALNAGKHLFIEKPITESTDQAELLVALAEKKNLKIQVGHVERFNPALLALEGIDLDPRFIEAHRLVKFVPRGLGMAVVHENMIHDIDIILSLVKSPVKDIQATGVAVVSPHADMANARILFENGCIVNVTASRISLNPMRKMRIFQPETYITVDFQQGSTEVYRVSDKDCETAGDQVFDMEGTEKKIIYQNLKLPKQDAIYAEQTAFAKAIGENSTPVVSGRDGLEALRIAEKVNQLLLKPA